MAWLERHMVAQDRAMLEQAEEVARLKKELLRLQSHVSGQGLPSDAAGAEARGEERPPHY